jgi:hypothetical protein
MKKKIRKPKPREKITLETETRRKRRFLAYCAARGERPNQVFARAVDREMAGFKIEGAGQPSADQAADGPLLKIG